MAETKTNQQTPIVKKINKKKWNDLSEKSLQHLDTLKRYYHVDYTKRIVKIPMHFTKVNEIIDESLGSKTAPFVKRDILEKFSSLMHTIPNEFKVDIDLKIDDYQGYRASVVSKSILDAFEMFEYDVTKHKIKNALKVSALIVFGVIVFAWLFYLCSKHWFGEAGDPTHDTIHELIYTVAGVVLWEAMYIIFLPSFSYHDISYAILYRINAISLKDKNNKTLQILSGRVMQKYWRVDSRHQLRARKLLLIVGTALACFAGCKLCDVVEIYIKYGHSLQSLILAGLDILAILITLASAIGAISYYRDKGPFKRLILLFGIFSIALTITELVLLGIYFNQLNWSIAVKSIVFESLLLALSISYVVCIIILNHKKPFTHKTPMVLNN